MKALIVDDSKVVRMVSSTILSELNIESEQAENGEEALDKVSRNNYNFILLDWNMPVMNGYEFFLEAKKIEGFLDHTKVIFCTTESDIEKISSVIEQGASEYIMKPFSKDIVEDKLRYLEIIE